jgi:hypothetical protein
MTSQGPAFYSGAGREVMSQIIQFESAGAEHPLAVTREPSHVSIGTNALYIVFTSIDGTLVALRIASDLAKALNVPLTLVHLRTVPYVLPLDAANGPSPVETEAFVRRVRDVGREAGVDVRVCVYLCRDVQQVVPLAFKPQSLIVMAGKRSWWPTRTERWRRSLESAGHFVVFVDLPSTRKDPTLHSRSRGGGDRQMEVRYIRPRFPVRAGDSSSRAISGW